MSNSKLLKQLGSVKSGMKFRLSERVTTCCCHSFGALRYPYNALCSFHTSSSHNSDSSGGSAINVTVQECCVHINCNCDVLTFWVTVSDDASWQPTLFSETVSMVSERTSRAVSRLKSSRTTLALHATVFLSIAPSRLYHSFASCRGSLHSCHDAHFSQRVRLLSVVPASLLWDRERLSRFSFACDRHSKDSIARQSRR